MKIKKKKLLLGFIFILFLLPSFVRADELDDEKTFFVDPDFEKSGSDQIEAVLQAKNTDLYFYLDKDWWEDLPYREKKEVDNSITSLASTFTSHIYPTLTEEFGKEWRLGIDGNRHVTVLIHPMRSNAGGYVRTNDEYEGPGITGSNEREMVYLNADLVTSIAAPSYLAHEFMHLIIFNQKDKLRSVSEERWLSEMRSEYAPSFLGFDEQFGGSNLEQRINTFLNYPSDPLTEWGNEEADYGVVNLFGQYLVEKYGVNMLSSSLKSRLVGIESLHEILEEKGVEKDLSRIFVDFLVTVYVNDCSLGEEYCFDNEYLRAINVAPQVNFLPLKGSSSLQVNQSAKDWEGNWYKFAGGKKGALKIQFIRSVGEEFEIAYLVRDFTGEYDLNFLELDEEGKGKILVPGFGTDVSSVTLIPVVTTKKSGFSSDEQEVSFFWEATTITEEGELEKEEGGNDSGYIQRPVSEMGREELLAKIRELEGLLASLRSRLASLTGGDNVGEGDDAEVDGEVDLNGCVGFSTDLRKGMRREKVTCLQEFLKSRGEDIYPEGLVTGYFGPLTERAVIRFQERHKEDVLGPWDLEKGTGFVGETTRNKINELI